MVLCRWVLLCQWFSWFNAYCLTRTYSSSVEAALTVYAISVIMRIEKSRTTLSKDLKLFGKFTCQVSWMLAAATCIVIRPAGALFWTAVAGYVVFRSNDGKALACVGLATGSFVALMAMFVDRILYRRLV